MGAELREVELPPRGVARRQDRDGDPDRERQHGEPADAMCEVSVVGLRRRGSGRGRGDGGGRDGGGCGGGCDGGGGRRRKGCCVRGGARRGVREHPRHGGSGVDTGERRRADGGRRARRRDGDRWSVGKGRGRHSTHDRFCTASPKPDIPPKNPRSGVRWSRRQFPSSAANRIPKLYPAEPRKRWSVVYSDSVV